MTKSIDHYELHRKNSMCSYFLQFFSGVLKKTYVQQKIKHNLNSF